MHVRPCYCASSLFICAADYVSLCFGVEKGFLAYFEHGEMSDKNQIPAWKNSRFGTRIPTGNKNSSVLPTFLIPCFYIILVFI